ncbi:unnamed protein product, partial [Mesorhabditis belari]|uniref:C2H2-type domain-containing protein n=1 Tax=Mesorhabditis belari TaxID=2138241 RepID=A0AAF3EEK8_9BILA
MLSFWNKIKEKAIAILDEQIPSIEGKLNEKENDHQSNDPSTSRESFDLAKKRHSSNEDLNLEDSKRFRSFEEENDEGQAHLSQSNLPNNNFSMEASTIGWGIEDAERSQNVSTVTQNEARQMFPKKPSISREEAVVCKKCKKSADSLFARDFSLHLAKHETHLFRFHCGSCPFKQISDKKMATHWVDQHKKAPASTPKDLMTDEMRKNYEKIGRECFPDSLELILDWCDQPFDWQDDKLTEYRIKGVTKCEVCNLETQLSMQGLLKHAATHIDYKLYFCGLCKLGMTSAQAGFRHIAFKHEDVPLEQPIHIEANKSREFYRGLLLASSQCFPSIKKQFKDNLEMIFTNDKELMEKPLIERKKRKAALEIMKSTAKKSQGTIEKIPILNKPKRTRRVIKTESARGPGSRQTDDQDQEESILNQSENFETSQIAQASGHQNVTEIYNPYAVPNQANHFDPNESIYMPNYMIDSIDNSHQTPFNVNESADPNYQYLFL